jgi:hypothetical protein
MYIYIIYNYINNNNIYILRYSLHLLKSNEKLMDDLLSSSNSHSCFLILDLMLVSGNQMRFAYLKYILK